MVSGVAAHIGRYEDSAGNDRVRAAAQGQRCGARIVELQGRRRAAGGERALAVTEFNNVRPRRYCRCRTNRPRTVMAVMLPPPTVAQSVPLTTA